MQLIIYYSQLTSSTKKFPLGGNGNGNGNGRGRGRGRGRSRSRGRGHSSRGTTIIIHILNIFLLPLLLISFSS